jgi:lipopolysaccharide assembly outer membrane protein LptD (OstA)
MKRFGLAFAIVSIAAIVSIPVRSQTGGADAKDAKHILTTMPQGQGRLTLTALNIDRDWASSTVHLKGDVRVEIWTSPKNERTVTVLRADEVDYNEITGKLSPRGNVAITVEEAK